MKENTAGMVMVDCGDDDLLDQKLLYEGNTTNQKKCVIVSGGPTSPEGNDFRKFDNDQLGVEVAEAAVVE